MALSDKEAMTAAKLEAFHKQMMTANPLMKISSPWADRLTAHMGDSLLYGGLAGGIPLKKGPPIMSSAPGSKTPPPDRFTPERMTRMLASRMGWGNDYTNEPGPPSPFRAFTTAQLSEGQAVVFVIHNEQAIVIHDDLNLFPSDALVTQLRILVG